MMGNPGPLGFGGCGASDLQAAVDLQEQLGGLLRRFLQGLSFQIEAHLGPRCGNKSIRLPA